MANNTPAEYISHHIQNLTFGRTEDGSLGFAHSAKEASEMGFYAINVDSMFWSLLTGLIFCIVFKMVASKVSVSEPPKIQLFVELVIEMVAGSVKDAFHGKNALSQINSFSCLTVFENHPKCRILIFQFWHFSPIFVLLKK